MRKAAVVARWLSVTVGIVVLTSFAVDATVSPNGISQSALGILATSLAPVEECPSGTALMTSGEKRLCVDLFESSPHADCPFSTVRAAHETRGNLDASGCMPESQAGEAPWAFVTFHQAKELCAKAEKRLPNAEEWYTLALGTPDPKGRAVCNIASDETLKSGESRECVTPLGVFDAVGNVWEWVDETVVDGKFQERPLPESGYVTNANQYGVALNTNTNTPDPNFHEDYFWSDASGEYGVLRGGFYASKDDAGLYSTHAKTMLSFASDAIGFRCVKDL